MINSFADFFFFGLLSFSNKAAFSLARSLVLRDSGVTDFRLNLAKISWLGGRPAIISLSLFGAEI